MDTHRRLFAMDLATVVLTVMVTFTTAQVDLPFGGYYCFARCTAKCLENTVGTLQQCRDECKLYDNDALCTTSDSPCWLKCKDLVESGDSNSRPAQPRGINAAYNDDDPLFINVTWSPVESVALYILQYCEQAANWSNPGQTLVPSPMLSNFTKPASFCSRYLFRVASVTAQGVSPFSQEFLLNSPVPKMTPTLNITSVVNHPDEPYNFMGIYKSNSTIVITIEYDNISADWPMGPEDITVDVNFFLFECSIPDLNSAMPQPKFTRIPGTHTLTGNFPLETMTNRCKFMYHPDRVDSDACDTSYAPELLQTQYIQLNCDTVENSNCVTEVKKYDPLCGQVDKVKSVLLNPDSVELDEQANLTVQVTFEPLARLSYKNKQPLYYIALYGNATAYDNDQTTALQGVNLISVMGQVTTCDQLPFNETCNGNITSFNISGIHFNQLYGVMICAVLDKDNLKLPVINASENRQTKIRADAILIKSEDYMPSNTAMIVGISVSVALTVFAMIIGLLLCCWKKKTRENKQMLDMKLSQMKEDYEMRYTDLPKKNDIWELERRNLIIHQDKKLGSGAFGAVYLGRIIGKAAGHRDANSTLGINLMRAENCDVAVKMLPEYADDMSKSEFLKEINLMKSLGYHERMVNMLACVTESEPLCLIVEYCSGGDLLHFLRDRCKYMMKLDDLGIDYKNPSEDDEFDPDMVVTLKQLLMFTVQISYGLEYLSQKGFIHRDVAARNVLVHDRTEAKIGDFGLCRYVYADSANYKSKGGRLPVKWMSPEAIRHYEFSAKSDVWSFGILMFEIITLGGSPYPGIQPDDVQEHLERGMRMDQPDNCPDEFYRVMKRCWEWEPADRPEFSEIRQKLAAQLEEVTEAYSYLTLNAERDYYNVEYAEDGTKGSVVPNHRDLTTSELQAKTSWPVIGFGSKQKAPEPHPQLRDVDSGLDNESIQSISLSPPAVRKRTGDSDASDELLMTPLEQRRWGQPRFQFNAQQLPAVAEAGGTINPSFRFSIDDDGQAVNM